MTPGPDRPGRSLFIMLGDLSADRHTKHILRRLKERAPDLHTWGVGGPGMIADGFEALYNCEDFSVLEIVDQLKRLPFYKQMAERLLNEIEKNRPDCVLLVDYGGFNLRFATALRKRYPTLPIVYFISPQIWASRPWRVKTIAKTMTKMLTIFPFEVPIYRKHGVPVRHVGHPMLSVLPEPHSIKHRDQFCLSVGADVKKHLIGVFPGSRNSEVQRFMPMILDAVKTLAKERDDCEFVIAQANPRLRDRIQSLMLKHGIISSDQYAEMKRLTATSSPHSIPAPQLGQAGNAGILPAMSGNREAAQLVQAGNAGVPPAMSGNPEAAQLVQGGSAGILPVMSGNPETAQLVQGGSAGILPAMSGNPETVQLVQGGSAGILPAPASGPAPSVSTPSGLVGRPVWQRFHFVDGDRNYELMGNSDFVWAKSGTTSLEVATFGTPMIAFYRADWPSFIIWLMFKRIKWVSMANLLTGKPIIPEDYSTGMSSGTTRKIYARPSRRACIEAGNERRTIPSSRNARSRRLCD